MSESAAIATLVEALNAGLDADEETASYAGPARIAWLTYRTDDGQMLYTTVAARHADEHPWVADGKELPEPAKARTVYDPARVHRRVKATRDLIAAILAGPHHRWPGVSACLKATFPDEECACGRDARVELLLGILAAAYEPATATA